MAQERRSTRTVLLAGVVVLGLGAIGAVGAVQAGGPFNGMWSHGGMGGPGFGGPMIGSMLDRALGSVDASDAQRAEIRGIVDEASAEIGAMTADADTMKKQVATLLAAETIDRAAFETLRRQALETGDAVSARALEAFLDAAEVLSPDQRTILLERQNGFGPRFGLGRR